MQKMHSIRMAPTAKISWKQRILGCLLLFLAAFLAMEPLWECHDHLDNLIHLGPHGVPVILLLIACTGISLLKSFDPEKVDFRHIDIESCWPDGLAGCEVGSR